MKEYIYGKYKGNMTKYIGRKIRKIPAFQQEEGGNLTRTQFLRWPPVPKGKVGLPPKFEMNSSMYEPIIPKLPPSSISPRADRAED